MRALLFLVALSGCRRAPSPAASCGDLPGSCPEVIERFAGNAAEAPRVARSLEAACDRGEDRACAALGAFYAAGSGVPKNPVRAAELWERACAGADPAEGCQRLGEAYRTGSGTPRDEPRAAQLFERACEAGSGRACWALSQLYRDGRRFPADFPRTAPLKERACSLGYTPACR